MILSYSLKLYGFIITMYVVQGYILFAANMEDLRKIAKLIAPNDIVKILSELSINTDIVNKIKNRVNDNNETIKRFKIVHQNEMEEEAFSRAQAKKPLTGFHDANQYLIYQLAEEIKQRVMKELIFKFLHSKYDKEYKELLNKAKKEQEVANKKDGADKKVIAGNDGTIIVFQPIEVTEIRKGDGSTIKSIKQAKNFSSGGYGYKIKIPYSKIAKEKFTTRYTDERTTNKYTTTNPTYGYKPVKVDTKEYTSGRYEHPNKNQKTVAPETRMNKINFYQQLAKKRKDFDETIGVGGRESTRNQNKPKTYVKLMNEDDEHETKLRDSKHKNKINIDKLTNLNKAKRYEVKNQVRVDDESSGTGELKAITGFLWFNDDVNDTMIITDGGESRKDYIRNTMKPTLSRFSMTTPNYYGSLPTVAERYDFKEPIPERDRIYNGKRWVKKYP